MEISGGVKPKELKVLDDEVDKRLRKLRRSYVGQHAMYRGLSVNVWLKTVL